jgi:hypothetical protein
MRKTPIFLLAFTISLTTNCQNKKTFLNNFPVLQNADTIMKTIQFARMYYSKESEKNTLDTMVALHYFFDDNIKNMHDIEVGHNADENTYIYTPYTKTVRPLYKKIINKEIYLLCYGIESIIYLAMYNIQNDKLEDTFIIADLSNEAGTFTWSTIFPNNYIVTAYIITVQSTNKVYYILSKIDYEFRKFIELKKIETTPNQTYNDLESNAFKALGISETGQLLENNP